MQDGCGVKNLQSILDIPSADVAPVVHGRWEQDADGDWYCTNCFASPMDGNMDYR